MELREDIECSSFSGVGGPLRINRVVKKEARTKRHVLGFKKNNLKGFNQAYGILEVRRFGVVGLRRRRFRRDNNPSGTDTSLSSNQSVHPAQMD